MIEKNEIVEWHEKILSHLLDYRKQHPDFTFWLRQKDNQGRLSDGYWFQGADYIFMGYSQITDTKNKTQSIGFQVSLDCVQPKCFIDIVFKSENDHKLISFYQELADRLSCRPVGKNKNRFQKEYSSQNIIENLNQFLEQDKPVIDRIMKEHRVEKEVRVPQDVFAERLKKMESQRKLNETNIESGNESISYLNHSKNIIFYGPPGTGKTYEIRNKLYPRFTEKQNTLTKEEFLQELVENYTWWQVLASALVDLKQARVIDLKGHSLVQAKQRNNAVKYFNQTIWGHLQSHTVLDCPNVKTQSRLEPLIFYKEANSIWRVESSLISEAAPEAEELLEKSKHYQADTKEDRRYRFVTFHQSTTYEDFIEGIKPVMDAGEGEEVKYRIEDGVFKRIAKLALEHPDKEYALFIDEINRGNIANIFGELITLIEEDKRLGNAEALRVTLPYSKEAFGVPPNLYIIGTMNTADRSVEALDTALRRRFSFIEMPPRPGFLTPGYMVWQLFWDYKDYEWDDPVYEPKEKELFSLLGATQRIRDQKEDFWDEWKKEGKDENQARQLRNEDFTGVNLKLLLETINKRIEKLLDHDHLIGHSYFMKVFSISDLKALFQNKVIPLLQEYFYGDYGKIGLVLGKGFFENDSGQGDEGQTIFADFNNYDPSDYLEKPIYRIRNILHMQDEEFNKAIDTLYNKSPEEV